MIKASEETLRKAKLRARKISSDVLDEDIKSLAEAVLWDLKRIGVHEEYLTRQDDPLIMEAILNYVSANYGMDENHDRYMDMYNMVLTKIKGGRYKEWTQ